MIKWQIGCSGFHYNDWRGIFYPEGMPKRKWFEYYCTYFNTLELNVTFYRFPQLHFLENWYNSSPPDFSFSVKAPRLITHYKRFNETERMLGDFYRTSKEGLKEKLGCILIQLPSGLVYTEQNLDRIVQQLDGSCRNVLEFRHESWWNRKVYERLKSANISFCGHSYPELPDKAIINSPTVYYRFHGLPKLYYSQYKRSQIEEVKAAIESSRQVKSAYIYFNNTATIAALRNAIYLKSLADPGKKKAIPKLRAGL